MKYHLLIIDDDNRIRELLEKYLDSNNFYVSIAKDTKEGEKILNKYKVNLIVLDRMMPEESGEDFMIRIRNKNKLIPILMLTAMGETNDKLFGLENGADDYLTKPFEPKELILRINNILSRINRNKIKDNSYLFKNCIFDASRGEVIIDNVKIILSDTETKLLEILCKNMDKIISRDDISKQVAGISERSIDVQITRLRKKIEKDSKNPQYLHTIRSEGYILYS